MSQSLRAVRLVFGLPHNILKKVLLFCVKNDAKD